MTKATYQISVRGPVPPDLAKKLAQTWAVAIKSAGKATLAGCGKRGPVAELGCGERYYGRCFAAGERSTMLEQGFGVG